MKQSSTFKFILCYKINHDKSDLKRFLLTVPGKSKKVHAFEGLSNKFYVANIRN